MIEETICFDDVLLVPQFSEIKSRSEINIETILHTRDPNIQYILKAPFISAPMDTVTESEMAFQMKNYGGLGIIHRYNTIEQQVAIVDEFWGKCGYPPTPSAELYKKNFNIGAAVGATGDFLERAKALEESGVNIICVDVAHGHHIHVKNALETLTKELSPHVHLMTGNVATAEAWYDLFQWGANSVRVGVGGGAACSTRIKTAHGVPLLQSLLWINTFKKDYWKQVPSSKLFEKFTTIADGGIRNGGDVVKAFAAGADAIMIGSLLAGSKASPGGKENIVITDGRWMKPFRGMACYSQDTEILTQEGWKLFPELVGNELIATLNHISGELEYQNYENYFAYEYNGKMLQVINKYIDLCVTPNHKLYLAKRTDERRGYFKKYRLIEAEDAYKKIYPNYYFKRNCIWNGNEKETFTLPDSNISFNMDRWLDFYGFWLAEGCTYTYKQNKIYDTKIVSFSNTDKELFDKHVKILSDFGIKGRVRIRSGTNKVSYELVIYNRKLFNYLSKFGKASEKFIDRQFMGLSSRQLKILLGGIFDGDGCKSRNCIYTTSLKLKDDISEISMKCGSSPKISLTRKAGVNYKQFKRNYDLYSININPSSNYGNETFVKSKKHVWMNYSGIVYCITVPNHIVYVRRNNKPVWSGNSYIAQKDWGRVRPAVEGVSTIVPYTGKVEVTLDEIFDGVKSGLSYSGAKNVSELRKKCRFIRQSVASQTESKPHILK